MATRFQNGHAFNARFKQGVFHSIQLRRLENGFDLDHMQLASFDSVTGSAMPWASGLKFSSPATALSELL
jgi:hypothetical protein